MFVSAELLQWILVMRLIDRWKFAVSSSGSAVIERKTTVVLLIRRRIVIWSVVELPAVWILSRYEHLLSYNEFVLQMSAKSQQTLPCKSEYNLS